MVLPEAVRKMREEHILRMEGEDRSTLEKYVQDPEGQMIINWDALCKMNREYNGHNDISPDFDNILRYLEFKHRLSFEGEKDAFFLVASGGVDMSPSDGHLIYHFMKRDDAEAYKKAEHSGKLYRIRLAQNV